MIYYIVNESFTNIMAFVSILFAFAFTIAAIALGKNLLPRDAGRAYAINGSKSVGKPRGAGMIFILRKLKCRTYHLSYTCACRNAQRIP